MAMDVPRKDAARRKWIRRIVVTAVLLVVVPAVSIMIGRLQPAAPVVEWSSIWPDQVKRGPMLRQERGLGTLVAEEVLYIPAVTDGRVEKIHVRPGTEVRPDTLLVTLSNPELMQTMVDWEFQVKMAEAQYKDLKVQLASQTLTQRADLARIETDASQATLRFNRDESLYKEGLLIELTYKISKSNAEDLARRVELEKERLKIRKDAVEAQLAVSQASIDKLKAMLELKRSQVEQLKVKAGVVGVLQELPGPTVNSQLQEGQRLSVGTVIAKVAQPSKLKAELKIAETRIKDIAYGQLAQIDTRNGIIPGRVSRIDPAAKEGTFLVDVKLEGALPAAARPDLSVDGTIEIEKLADVMFVGRPAFGQPNSTVSMFKIDPDERGAQRVQVKFGRTSVTTIEVLEGLRVGDKVVLSDMSTWDSHERVQFKK